ncbi:MAG: hypothetical protein R2705_03185 [Ilumatobacteraceae bacterium]
MGATTEVAGATSVGVLEQAAMTPASAATEPSAATVWDGERDIVGPAYGAIGALSGQTRRVTGTDRLA